MTVIHEAPPSAADVAGAMPASTAERPASIWQRPAIFRYGFVAFILVLWEIVGPFINPIFFSYPSKIATAAFYLTIVRRACLLPWRRAWR